jgi:hypothetical protein
MAQVGIIAGSNASKFDPSFTLEKTGGVVDHDLGDGWVGQQGLKRARKRIDNRLRRRSASDRVRIPEVFHQMNRACAALRLGNADEFFVPSLLQLRRKAAYLVFESSLLAHGGHPVALDAEGSSGHSSCGFASRKPPANAATVRPSGSGISARSSKFT